ncbi:MAG: ABC transporter ATP-binding protein [Angelakisella sp.]|nr:ABC transporter ATP-binding protein [Angelakisella sp.]
MNNPVLRLENVTMQFGGVVAVDDLSMEVREGEIVALIGPNGAGKTTAFNVVTGVYAPTNGCLYLDGKPYLCEHPKGRGKREYLGVAAEKFAHQPTLRKTPDQITKMGLARTFQNIRLFGNLTVFENVLIAKHMHARGGFLAATFRLNRKEEARMRREAMELLDIVGLADQKDEQASSLPYGQQRRLEIARALATDPRLLILDEPAAGMNPQETVELTAFIREIREKFNLSILLIEHHMNLVMDISDRIYVLEFGKLIAEGKPDAVRADPRVIEAYLGVDLDA